MTPDRTRSEPQRQRGFIARLSTSIDSLPRLRLGLPPIPGLQRALPIRPAMVLGLLERLSEGTGDLELLRIFEARSNQ